MGSRNFYARTRDMVSAARWHLTQARQRKGLSFSSVDSIATKAKPFLLLCKEENGVGRLEGITREMLIVYGRDLGEEVESGDVACTYAHNLVSSVNSVMDRATNGQWISVSPTIDCNIPPRCHFRQMRPGGLDADDLQSAIDDLTSQDIYRPAALVYLCRVFGLRTKEAALLDLRAAIKQLVTKGEIDIRHGTKGGLLRQMPVHCNVQLAALTFALQQVSTDRCLVPENLTWQKWRDTHLNGCRQTLKLHAIRCFHDLRAAYACQRYLALTGEPAPVCGGTKVAAELDRAARMTIAVELGHGRVGVVASYIGKVLRK
ncbi:MAG: integrase domain-containing protein [Pseudomonadota bacterium]